MHEFTIIKDIVIILLISLPIIFLFHKIKIPSIVGFLVAGMIIGPYGFQLITELTEIEIMAEIGVILLLFTIGLEVSLSKLIQMKRLLLLAGGMQVLFTILISAGISILFGLTPKQSIYIGMLVSLSSTAIVLKLLAEKNELEAPHGRLALGILIFQDLAIVPMILLLPVLGTSGETSLLDIITQLVFAFAAIVVIVLLAKFLMPKILYHLTRLRIREAFIVGILLLLLGTAYLTHSIGLSFALGAFIAGLILSESDYSHQIVSEVLPLKDAFNSIFFVSVGLLLNLGFVIKFPLSILAVTFGVILLKASIILILIKLLKYPLRIAILVGIGLAQVGEFSFVLSRVGLDYNLIQTEFYNAFLASSIFTMILTPFLFQLKPIIANKFGSIEPIKKSSQKDESKKLKNHVIIVGFGLNGKNLARVLRETGINYLVIEMNPNTVKAEKEKNENITYGDITKEEILHYANVEEANVIVFAISDPSSTRRGVLICKKLNPEIHLIVRTRFTSEVEELLALGADEVIPEEFETSLQLFSKVLRKYHIPLNVIMQQVALLRGESYKLMLKEKSDLTALSHLNEILAAGLTETYFVNEENPYSGKTLQEINLRAETNATIIAIVRSGETIANPNPKESLQVNDTLVITGTHQAVDEAINYLNGIKD